MRKPNKPVEVEGTTGSAKERKLGLRNRIDKLKKRFREMEVPFKERKNFLSGCLRNQRDRIKCFSCRKQGILLEIVLAKEIGIISLFRRKQKKVKNEFLEKKNGIR